jgi:hypothetical protein
MDFNGDKPLDLAEKAKNEVIVGILEQHNSQNRVKINASTEPTKFAFLIHIITKY